MALTGRGIYVVYECNLSLTARKELNIADWWMDSPYPENALHEDVNRRTIEVP